MNGRELREQVRAQKADRHCFIRWSRKENDFADFELLDDFFDNLTDEQEFESFELLDMEQMWQTLQNVDPDHLHREKRNKGEVVVWDREEKGTQVCPFIADSLMTIFNVETRGDVID